MKRLLRFRVQCFRILINCRGFVRLIYSANAVRTDLGIVRNRKYARNRPLRAPIPTPFCVRAAFHMLYRLVASARSGCTKLACFEGIDVSPKIEISTNGIR